MDQRDAAARVADAEGVRAVKRIQYAWGHYAEAGDVESMSALFDDDARLIVPPHDVRGRAEIERVLRELFGGRAAEERRLPMMMSPVVVLAPDGQSARARWHEFGLSVAAGGDGVWSGAIHENRYRKRDGRWRLSELHVFPLLRGSHLDGWHNLEPVTDEVPFHFGPDEAGTPVPRASRRDEAEVTPGDLHGRARAAVDESLVANLLHAYAFAMDRRSWDDVVDLFAADATLAVDDVTSRGTDAIRRYLLGFGPAGLRYGEIFDHVQTMPVVTVAADGRSATVRSIELRTVAMRGGRGTIGYRVCTAEAARIDGRWRFTSLRVVTRTEVDHARGWAGGEDGGRGPAPEIGFPHPVLAPSVPSGGRGADPAEVARLVDVAVAFDAAENVSCAYGYFLDDARWDQSAALFAVDGWKELSFIGTYVGRERIRDSLIGRYGTAPRKRDFLPIHQKLQPYVTVSEDGRRAQIRMKLLQINSGWDRDASVVTGVYENQVVQEDGVWRLHGMDLEYLTVVQWTSGWTDTPPEAARMFAPSPDAVASFRPVPDGPLRGQAYAPFPDTAPLGFHYRNPVSGRPPAVVLEWSDGFFGEDSEAAR